MNLEQNCSLLTSCLSVFRGALFWTSWDCFESRCKWFGIGCPSVPEQPPMQTCPQHCLGALSTRNTRRERVEPAGPAAGKFLPVLWGTPPTLLQIVQLLRPRLNHTERWGEGNISTAYLNPGLRFCARQEPFVIAMEVTVQFCITPLFSHKSDVKFVIVWRKQREQIIFLCRKQIPSRFLLGSLMEQ